MRLGITRWVAGILVAWAGGGLLAERAGAALAPPVIRGASLAQHGEDVVWRVKLSRGFSAASLGRAHASLCLLIERPSDGAVRAELCLAPGRHRRPPERLRDRRRKLIAATVRRPAANRLLAAFVPPTIRLGYRRFRWQVRLEVFPPRCSAAARASASSCTELWPARARSIRLHRPKLVGCAASGPDFVTGGPANMHEIALTFDDGPWSQTPQFLALLEREHVPATFFQIGQQIGQWGQPAAIERRMLRDGDMIGDHTWNHQNVSGGGAFASSEILRAAAAIRAATGGFTPCLFRAPYGATSSALLGGVRSLGMTTIQWNIDPRDWARPGVGAIESNVIANARNGGIVELHDGGGDRSETIAALPAIIHTLRGRGYRLVTISEMLGYRLIYK